MGVSVRFVVCPVYYSCPPCPLQLVEVEGDGCNMWIMAEMTSMLQLSQRV